MDRKEAERIIKILGMDWTPDEQPVEWDLYRRYTEALTRLIAATSHVGISAGIFAVVINQAHRLDKSPEWIEQELLFEARVNETRPRSEWLPQAMAEEGLIVAESQDLYNERLTRFTANG